jgi:hypothetical protein
MILSGFLYPLTGGGRAFIQGAPGPLARNASGWRRRDGFGTILDALSERLQF